MPEPELVTVPNVHLCSVGRFEVSVGAETDPVTGHPIWNVTPEQLASIVAAADDPAIRTPIVKFGHRDKVTDIEIPAVGHIENLRTSDDGLELYGDFTGVPKWLAEILPSAYPSRSVEVSFHYAASGTDRVHEAVLTACALLGETTPAIESLDDVKALYGGEYEELVAAAARAGADVKHLTAPGPVLQVTLEGKTLTEHEIISAVQASMAKRAAASVSIDTVRGEFYERLPAGSWAWVREVWSDFLIVDNDDNELFQVPWSEGTDGAIEFGDPVAVDVQYVPATKEADDGEPAMVMLSRSPAEGPRLSARTPKKPEGGHHMNKDTLAKLGLPEDATDEQVEDAVLANLDETNKPEKDAKPDTAELPDGVVAIDEGTLAELNRKAEAGAAASRTIAERDRDGYLTDAVQAGKFPPARKEHYQALYDADPEGTTALVDGLAAGVVPVDGTAVGHAGGIEAMSDEQIWQDLGFANEPKGA